MKYFVSYILKIFKSRKMLIICLVLILVGLVYANYIFTNQHKSKVSLTNDKIPDLIINPKKDNLSDKGEITSLLDKVNNLIELPYDEEPSIATVTNIDKLKDQPFFSRAKNGDRVIIYTQSKKAIIYRPSTNKLVEAGSVDIMVSDILKPSISPQETLPSEASGAADLKISAPAN